MPDDIRIRLVRVEFLRPGPPNNQLLSPLTQYLAICGDEGAGAVTVPYEHAKFQRHLKELRYETGDPEDRLAMLHDIGTEMGRILGAVPGLPGTLTGHRDQPGTLVHLRLTLSASELALLPFELAKVPIGPMVTAESWLAVQTRPPVCVTRNIRSVSTEDVSWPAKPRVLFVTGNPADIPYEEHRDALIAAVKPFRYPTRDDPTGSRVDREQFGELLTILTDPTLAEVAAECRLGRYTHIHFLTHGDLDETARDSYGLVFKGAHDAPDVVSGERIASAITSVQDDQVHRPTVVTVASCDSGNVGTVVMPGASLAHALHQAGVALVVASQFPLTVEGSVSIVGTFYRELLWGANPLRLLQQLRSELHARYTASAHDWASLVVYEALPGSLGEQLDALRYWQARRATNAALERVDRTVQQGGQQSMEGNTDESLAALVKAVHDAVDRLPLTGHYAMECLGLRASARKRLAQGSSLAAQLTGDLNESFADPIDLLESAWIDYDRAARNFLVNEAHAVQRIATLHWVLVQVVSLSAVLGKEFSRGKWELAKLAAELYRDHADAEERAWARGSLAELWLLRLSALDAGDDKGRDEAREEAVEHTREIVRLYPSRDAFPVTSTCRQFERYTGWWGEDAFRRELARHEIDRPAWSGKHGLLDTARDLVKILERRNRVTRERASGTAAPRSTVPAAQPAAPAGQPAGARQKLSADRAGARTTERTPRPRGAKSFFDIDMLPAGHGDSLWIEYGDGASTHRLLIDCGTQATSRELLRRVEALPERERLLELFVMTHIDSDHIGGALPFFKAVKSGLRFVDVWFNGWRHISGRLGARQGEMFSTAIEDFRLPWNAWSEGSAVLVAGDDLPVHVLPGGMQLTLLSPTAAQLTKLRDVWKRELKRYGLEPGARVDYRKFLKGTPSTSTDVDELADTPFSGDAGVPNGSSIAMLAEFDGAAALLTADAHAPVLVQSLRALLQRRGQKRLKLDAWKVSHHASQNNVSRELLELLDCPRYLVSTDGHHFCHPDRQAIGRIIKYGGKQPTLHFNYRSEYNAVWARADLIEKHGYVARYADEGDRGTTVSLL